MRYAAGHTGRQRDRQRPNKSLQRTDTAKVSCSSSQVRCGQCPPLNSGVRPLEEATPGTGPDGADHCPLWESVGKDGEDKRMSAVDIAGVALSALLAGWFVSALVRLDMDGNRWPSSAVTCSPHFKWPLWCWEASASHGGCHITGCRPGRRSSQGLVSPAPRVRSWRIGMKYGSGSVSPSVRSGASQRSNKALQPTSTAPSASLSLHPVACSARG